MEPCWDHLSHILNAHETKLYNRPATEPSDLKVHLDTHFPFQNLTVWPHPRLGLLPEAGGRLVSRVIPAQLRRAQWRQGRG